MGKTEDNEAITNIVYAYVYFNIFTPWKQIALFAFIF